MAIRSAFRTSVEGDTALVVDLNGDVSVTNDAENVVIAVAGMIQVRRLLYRDSEKTWSEITFTRDKNLVPKFKGFRPIDHRDFGKFNLGHR